MIAKTSFYYRSEMWVAGEVKDVTAHIANELKQANLVDDAKGEIEGVLPPSIQPNFESIINEPIHAKRETKPTTKKVEKK
ncbi:hypothetical protein [Hymenobacter sublimis]|uniref:Uncharacterized protein n=1 Tax=Hymenobacter sublimis TaxID=2933777 RepID=A0ABY4JF07_9BACT|nr:hypothetical protein [Hymenobacter sublimis]UPL50524.1 hypothetical protein MWH26_06355 [Hymenobacter sublimis]